MKPIFIFLPILFNAISLIAFIIFFYIEALALTENGKTVYIAAILYTVIHGLLMVIQYLAEFLTPIVESEPVYVDTSIENFKDVNTYRFTLFWICFLNTIFLWTDVAFQHHQCSSDADICLSDDYIPLHRIYMLLCLVNSFSNLIVLSQSWYGYVRPNYAPEILAEKAYEEYLLDDVCYSASTEKSKSRRRRKKVK